jgi:hypothetical protein
VFTNDGALDPLVDEIADALTTDLGAEVRS